MGDSDVNTPDSDPWTCSCGRTFVVPSLAADCARRNHHDLQEVTARDLRKGPDRR